MEWLINRRRMMFNRVALPEYLAFEDRRVWEICCYNWGDTELVTGEIASGNITANGTDFVYGKLVFASCLVHPARKLSNGVTISSIAAAAQSFSVTIEILDSDPFSGMDNDTTIIQVRQYGSNTNTSTIIASATKADWESDNVDGTYTMNISATNACQYLRIGVLAASEVTASWSLSATTGNRQPVGITKKQCVVVSSLGTVFDKNTLIVNTADFLNFTAVTTEPTISSTYSLLYCICPPNITKMNSNAHQHCTNLLVYVAPATLTSIAGRNWFYNDRKAKAFIIKSVTPPTLAAQFLQYATGKIYVPDDSVNTYKAANNWSTNASSIYGFSQLAIDYPTYYDMYI